MLCIHVLLTLQLPGRRKRKTRLGCDALWLPLVASCLEIIFSSWKLKQTISPEYLLQSFISNVEVFLVFRSLLWDKNKLNTSILAAKWFLEVALQLQKCNVCSQSYHVLNKLAISSSFLYCYTLALTTDISIFRQNKKSRKVLQSRNN